MPNNYTAAQSGDRRQALEVLRDTLAEQLDMTDKQIHAQLAAQYRATLAELDELPVTEGKSARERFEDRVSASRTPA